LLWIAIRLAKNQNVETLPKNISENGVKIPEKNVPEKVGEFFDNKGKRIVRESETDPSFYNSRTKILSNNCFYMGRDDILDCMSSLKIKNFEGYDRIPQRIIKDGIDLLIVPLSFLFKLIYDYKTIPYHWRIAKVNPIPEKGQKMKSANIGLSQIFVQHQRSLKKVSIKRVIDLQDSNNVDLIGDQQHGF
jgi:hypothetical protein